MTQKNPIAPGTGGATTPAGRAPGGVAVSGAADISAFLKTAAAVGPQMFTEAARVGTLDIQLVFFRGMGECRSSGWIAEAAKLP